jgi:hypothetical protein
MIAIGFRVIDGSTCGSEKDFLSRPRSNVDYPLRMRVYLPIDWGRMPVLPE